MSKKSTKKPKQAVNQFLHSNKPSRTRKGNSHENCEDDIEIGSPVYPKENGVIILHLQGQKDVAVKLQITNHFPSSVVFDSLVKNKKKLPFDSTEIKSGQSICYPVQVHINSCDHVYTYLQFHFYMKETDTNIMKKILISAREFIPDVDELKPTSPYRRPPAAVIQRGEAPPNIIYPAPSLVIQQRNDLPKFKLEHYRIPDHIRKIVNHGFLEDTKEMNSFLSPERGGEGRGTRGYHHYVRHENEYVTKNKNILKSKLTKDSYKEIFQQLLYLEEMQGESNMARFKIEDTPMYYTAKSKNGIYLDLEIAGIIDSNANVHKYGRLVVRIIEDGKLSKASYEGNIEDIKTSCVSLHFGKELAKNYDDDMRFQVQFVPSRNNLRHQHRAINLIQKYSLWPVLFPLNIGQLGTKLLKIKTFFDENIGQNPEQQTAVRNIVSGVSRPCPYIVFGPPGTGKTVTLLESMRQVITLAPESHILACAFSNAAADILVKKLIDFLPPKKLLRMYAISIDFQKINKKIQKYSNYSEDGCPFFPSKEELEEYNIIICTVSTAGRLSSPDFIGHFSHIFIDECGFCMEPEIVVAFAGILDLSKTQLVLAGDPKQLGPIITSPYAKEYKLDVSLLERLMTTIPIYKRQPDGTFDQRVITKLLKNYRSHPVILKVVNDLFYDRELQTCANMKIVSQFCNWDLLPVKNFPLLIHSVVGKEEREGNSPSYFNAEEALTVVNYIEKLHNSYKILPFEIGVITPYCKQVQKINILLQKAKIGNVKVNSVEKFLGDERMIIIISTVRSNPEDQENNYKNSLLGFLTNEKRFNVAVSRPKALLIVVGNIKSLYNDPNWASLISYCTENNSIKAETMSACNDLKDYISSQKKEVVERSE